MLYQSANICLRDLLLRMPTLCVKFHSPIELGNVRSKSKHVLRMREVAMQQVVL